MLTSTNSVEIPEGPSGTSISRHLFREHQLLQSYQRQAILEQLERDTQVRDALNAQGVILRKDLVSKTDSRRRGYGRDSGLYAFNPAVETQLFCYNPKKKSLDIRDITALETVIDSIPLEIPKGHVFIAWETTHHPDYVLYETGIKAQGKKDTYSKSIIFSVYITSREVRKIIEPSEPKIAEEREKLEVRHKAAKEALKKEMASAGLDPALLQKAKASYDTAQATYEKDKKALDEAVSMSPLWLEHIYKNDPSKILINIIKTQTLPTAETMVFNTHKTREWQIYDLVSHEKKSLLSYVQTEKTGSMAIDSTHLVFGENEEPIFWVCSIKAKGKYSSQAVYPVVKKGESFVIEDGAHYSIGEGMHDLARLHTVDSQGAVYLSKRSNGPDGLDYWTPIVVRKKRGGLWSEDFILPEDSDKNHANIKHLYPLEKDGKTLAILCEMRNSDTKRQYVIQPMVNPNTLTLEQADCLEQACVIFAKLQSILSEEQLTDGILGENLRDPKLDIISSMKNLLLFSQASDGARRARLCDLQSKQAQLLELPHLVGTQQTAFERKSRPIESVFITAHDGKRLHALWSAPEVQPGQSIPLFLFIHGGPHAKSSAFSEERNGDFHYLRSQGIAVLDVNYPGSTNDSLSFKNFSDGAWDQLSGYLVDAIDWAIATQAVDPKRIIVGGVSAGAVLSIDLAARFPGKVQLAIAINGVYDYAGMVQEAIEGKNIHSGDDTIKQAGGDPRIPEQRLELLKKSPISIVGNVQCPVIIIAGTKDDNCLPHQSETLARDMQAVGKALQYYTVEGAGHSLERKTELPKTGTATSVEVETIVDYSAWQVVSEICMPAIARITGIQIEPSVPALLRDGYLGRNGVKQVMDTTKAVLEPERARYKP